MCLAACIWNYNKWISSFLILTTFSAFWPVYGLYGYLAGKAVFHGCLWYFFLMSYFSVQNLNALYRIMRIAVYFHVFVALIQKSNLTVMFKVPMIVGLMSNSLELSALVTICLPAFLVLKRWKILLILIPIAGMILAKQFLGIIAFGAGAIFYLAVAHRMYWPVIPAIAGAVLWYKFIDEAFPSLRLYVWKQAIAAWYQHWILGAGIGHWKVVFAQPMKIDGCRWMTTHNEFLQMLFEVGIAAPLILIGYLTEILGKVTRKHTLPLSALVIAAVHCAASFPMHIAPIAMIIVTWLAILDITTGEQKKYELHNAVV